MSVLYLFSLILGGGFLLLSVLGGGGEGDVDFDGGLELDAGDMELDALEGGTEAAGDTAASRIFSLRTVVYALFGFGATGSVMSWLGVGMLTTLAFALVGGAASGLLVSLVFHFLQRSESGTPPGDSALLGLAGVVTLPMGATSPGTVALEHGGRRVVLRALPHSTGTGDPGSWTRVVVVDVEGGLVRVAPLDADELEALGP